MGGGGGRGLRYTRGAQINFGDLTPFLIYAVCTSPSVLPVFHLPICAKLCFRCGCSTMYCSFIFFKPIFVTTITDLRRSSWWWWACPRRASPCPPPGWSPAPSPPSSGSPWWARRAARQQTSGLKQDSLIIGSISRDIFGLFYMQEKSQAWV